MIVNRLVAPDQSYSPKPVGKQDLGKRDFLQLLIVQLQNQNPLEPLKNEQFLAQLAQFSTLEQIQTLNANISALSQFQVLSQAASLIGRRVTAKLSGGETIQGEVKSVDFSSGYAQLKVKANEKNYLIPISQILTIE